MTATTSNSDNLSLVYGPTSESLWTITLGALVEVQARLYGDRTAVVFPWQNLRRTYRDLHLRSKTASKALLESGLQYGDSVGIFAGNCCEYLDVLLGAAAIGCPVVVLNCNYTPTELESAVTFSGCKLLCAARYPGPQRDVTPHLDRLLDAAGPLHVILFDDSDYLHNRVTSFDAFFRKGEASRLSEVALSQRQALVRPIDTLNLQFTSDALDPVFLTVIERCISRGASNLINNARFVGDKLALTANDIVCCPAPLFHCFGLSMGFLGTLTHGSAIVFPSQQFDAHAAVAAVEAEQCTVLYGVPTMFRAELDALATRRRRLDSLRIALAAGSPVLPSTMKQMGKAMGIGSVLIAYGMTETSPVTFATSIEDSLERRLRTVGTVFPHTGAKIVDGEGHIVPRGIAGEILTSGYALQQGYLKNEAKTHEAMRADADGTLWMHTGDEGVIDRDGYCRVTGRIKDMIIRGKRQRNHTKLTEWGPSANNARTGGENIIPTEIEERLQSHGSIAEAAVVGAPHAKFGEQVVAFVRQAERAPRPSTAEIAVWVRETLGRHKAPEHVFWLGDRGVGGDFPKTGSGKLQKHILQKIAMALLEQPAPRARL
ncbi:hypothetical protein LTR53_002893 [Teratosphaeriaceae sp. CCFEE 6253]|nr:hypothetical protein LTR53_002893 [Teratosphaeriaceae sp. CCFEE 6253]